MLCSFFCLILLSVFVLFWVVCIDVSSGLLISPFAVSNPSLIPSSVFLPYVVILLCRRSTWVCFASPISLVKFSLSSSFWNTFDPCITWGFGALTPHTVKKSVYNFDCLITSSVKENLILFIPSLAGTWSWHASNSCSLMKISLHRKAGQQLKSLP